MMFSDLAISRFPYVGSFTYTLLDDAGNELTVVNPSIFIASPVSAVIVNELGFEKRYFPSLHKKSIPTAFPDAFMTASASPHAE